MKKIPPFVPFYKSYFCRSWSQACTQPTGHITWCSATYFSSQLTFLMSEVVLFCRVSWLVLADFYKLFVLLCRRCLPKIGPSQFSSYLTCSKCLHSRYIQLIQDNSLFFCAFPPFYYLLFHAINWKNYQLRILLLCQLFHWKKNRIMDRYSSSQSTLFPIKDWSSYKPINWFLHKSQAWNLADKKRS